MNTETLLEASMFLQLAMTCIALCVILLRKANRIFPQLALLLGVQGCALAIAISIMWFRQSLHLSLEGAYATLYLSTWAAAAIIFLFRILIVYAVFAEAMRPMTGLHQAGKIIFRWVGVVSSLVAFALVAGPGVFSSREALANVFSHLQQGVSVLTLCLLVFVCFAVRPLGLTFRSHIFGVSLGLGIASMVELVQAAWMVTRGAQSVYSPIYLFSSLGFCVPLGIWTAYFGMPEPARRMILLPTTSPFFFWNRISEILGDAPGHVAVAGFSPDMLAPAEIEMLTAATAGESPSDSTTTQAFVHPEQPAFAGARRPSLA